MSTIGELRQLLEGMPDEMPVAWDMYTVSDLKSYVSSSTSYHPDLVDEEITNDVLDQLEAYEQLCYDNFLAAIADISLEERLAQKQRCLQLWPVYRWK